MFKQCFTFSYFVLFSIFWFKEMYNNVFMQKRHKDIVLVQWAFFFYMNPSIRKSRVDQDDQQVGKIHDILNLKQNAPSVILCPFIVCYPVQPLPSQHAVRSKSRHLYSPYILCTINCCLDLAHPRFSERSWLEYPSKVLGLDGQFVLSRTCKFRTLFST